MESNEKQMCTNNNNLKNSNMKKLTLIIIATAGIFTACTSAYGRTTTESDTSGHEWKIYLGAGSGFDYGGIGGKIEYLPIKHIGLFGGIGYNLLSVGWNVGVTYKILPDKTVSPNLMVLYGYNAVFVGTDNYSKQYEMTSYGVSIGANLDIKIVKRGHKLSVGLFYPFFSDKFNKNQDKAVNDRMLQIYKKAWPIGFSVGFNFLL
jgi:hypothetical protein